MIPRLTIAIPTFNRHRLLRQALQSALAQTSLDIEILVSDNGSTDETPQLLAEHNDPRLRKLRLETTLTRADHGTFIFGVVRTELVLILSDDDYIEPNFATEIIQLFDEHPEISFAYTGCIEHYDDALLPALTGPRVEDPLDFFANHYAGRRQVSWCACVTRAQDIRDCGPQPNDRIIGDMFFWTKIGFKGPVGCVARALSHYSVLRPSGDNESRTVPILAWGHEVKLIAEEVMEKVKTTRAGSQFERALLTQMRHYTTQSIANQFLWARVYGMSRLDCLRIIPGALHYSGWTISSAIRVCAALALSRRVIRHLIVRSAAKMGATRRSVPQQVHM